MKNIFLLSALLFIVSFSFTASAQPGSLDPTFNPYDKGFKNGDRLTGVVYTSVLQSDGKILVGGEIRLNPDRTIDTTFDDGSGSNGEIYTSVVQNTGKIILGGAFNGYAARTEFGFVRILPNGNFDYNFSSDISASTVYSISLQNDGYFIVGGYFMTGNTPYRTNIARFHPDGYIDASFEYRGASSGFVYSTAVQSDGKIIIGGDFRDFYYQNRKCIARLNEDGTLDSLFKSGTGANEDVRSIAIQDDGKIIIGGDFTSYNGISVNRIARLNPDGTLDMSFNPGTGLNERVSTIAIQKDGKIIIGGRFTACNDISRVYLTRLNSNGSIDDGFYKDNGLDNFVNTITILDDGDIFIGGSFTSCNETSIMYSAILNPDGSLDTTFNPSYGANGDVNVIENQNDGKIIIGGEFTSYNGKSRNGVARLNIDGSLDASFRIGPEKKYNVEALAIQNDGKIIVGCRYRNQLTRLNVNGTLDSTFMSIFAGDDGVRSLCIQKDGKIIVGGYFNNLIASGATSLARVNKDGSIDSTFKMGTGVDGTVFSIKTLDNGKIMIGGSFDFYNGTAVQSLVRINEDGTLDTTFIFDNIYSVYSLDIQNDGKIIIGGSFKLDPSINIYSCVLRVNSDGSLDTSFSNNTVESGSVYSTAIQEDGKIIIGGYFISLNGTPTNYFARLNSNGSIDTTFLINGVKGKTLNSVSIQSDGRILIGGTFTSYDGIGRNRIARVFSNCTAQSSMKETACVSYTSPDGKVHTTSGVKTAAVIDLAGCNNVYTIDLIVKTSLETPKISINNKSIKSNVTTSLEWYNKDGIILGAADQTYTPTESGEYYAIATMSNCKSNPSNTVSFVMVGNQELGYSSTATLFPNPVSDALTVEIPSNSETVYYEIHNTVGQTILKGEISGNTTLQTSKLSPGVYYIKLENEYLYEYRKFVKN